MGIPLRIAEPTGMYRRMLRRYTFKNDVTCSVSNWGHDASTVIGDIDETEAHRVHGDNWPHDDERWPKTCAACQYVFVDNDQWQRNDNSVYRLPDGVEFMKWGAFGKNAPAGTMIRADWYDEYTQKQFALGELTESWLIALPDGGEWMSTQKASDGGYWTVTGTPPNITATPSIWHNAPKGWHGFVRNGELVDA